MGHRAFEALDERLVATETLSHGVKVQPKMRSVVKIALIDIEASARFSHSIPCSARLS